MRRNIYFSIAILALTVFLNGCKDFLDAKPYNTLAQPSTLKDLRALLDHEDFVNNVYPVNLAVASDEFFITDIGFNQLPLSFREAYIWEDEGTGSGPWTTAYRTISIANVVLESLNRIEGGNSAVREQLEGEALFLRGWMFFHLAQVYCAPFSVLEENKGLGLVLRMDSDSEVKIGRSNLADTYEQLFSDLTKALLLLPDHSEHKTRPSKAVAYAALARAYLVIGDFQKAEAMTDSLFRLKKDLLDYNSLDESLRYPILFEENIELLYYARCGSAGNFMGNANTYISPEIYALYETHDLRKDIYFIAGAEGMKFRGYYNGALSDYFAGLAMDEMYLIKAECTARRGEIAEGNKYLNELRKHRYEDGHYTPLNILDRQTLVEKVLEERKRQLVCRGLSWLDLRRLNKEPEFARTLERHVRENEVERTYQLIPNDLRYTFLIPNSAVEVGNYEQNPR